ncbi:hypothetical protein DER44DRAFT_890360 [Fusarium oxysporum]|nr:hypothetical protein DER44DRAFT_890360 [Fusarium oxysporum]
MNRFIPRFSGTPYMDSFPVRYDALLCAQGGDIHRSWDRTFNTELVRRLEIFVAEQIGGRGPAKFMENDTSEGTYNRVLRFNFESSSSDVSLKFPKPGHTAANLADEKIANKANWMQYLKERTDIPIPCVYSHGAKGDGNPLELPYILMDWVPGYSLRDFLKEKPSLRSHVYEQIASHHVQLYRLPFERIGSVAKDNQTGKWAITKRPLTMDMHQFSLGIHKFPTDAWPTRPLESTSAYFDFVVSQQEVQLWHLRDVNGLPVRQQEDSQPVPNTDTKSSDMARRRYISRYGFKQLINQFCISYDDPQPFHFALDLPLWLSPVLPEQCLDRGFFPWFLREYRLLLEEFLAAMKRVEGRLGYKSKERPLLAHMLESWHTDRVWFNFAATHTDHIDSIYWEKLCKYHPAGVKPELPE